MFTNEWYLLFNDFSHLPCKVIWLWHDFNNLLQLPASHVRSRSKLFTPATQSGYNYIGSKSQAVPHRDLRKHEAGRSLARIIAAYGSN